MTTKTPATPLPWHTEPGTVDGATHIMEGKRVIAEFFGYESKQNAQNCIWQKAAYPKLVEALRCCVNAADVRFAIKDAQSLLRELGEL